MDSKARKTEFDVCSKKYGATDLSKVFSAISSSAERAGLREVFAPYPGFGSYLAFVGIDESGRPFCETEWFKKITSPEKCKAAFAARFLENRLKLSTMKCLLDAGLEGGVSAAEFLVKAYANGDVA